MDTNTSTLDGVFAPVLTPFTQSYQPNPTEFVRLCKWLISQDVGLAMFGTNSEGNSLTVQEKLQLLSEAIDAGIPAHRMLPGTGSCSLQDAVTLSRSVASHDCAGALVLPPFYYKGVADEGLFRFYSELIEQVGDNRLRVYLYHIPPVAQVGFSINLIERLLKRYPQTIAGVKDTGGDWDFTARLIDVFGKSDFNVFAGTETILLKTLQRGGRGCISATANINPREIVNLYQQWQTPAAESLQQKLNTLREIFQAYPLISAMKSEVARASQNESWNIVRPPLLPLNDIQASELRQKLDTLGFAIRSFV